MQKLILPINKSYVTAGYKNIAYFYNFKRKHFGWDIVSSDKNRSLYASGNGTVTHCGQDNIFGNVIIIIYKDTYNIKTKKYSDVVFRYYHLESINVKVGQKVDKDTCIGIYGNTGRYSQGQHLHLEVDIDSKYPNYTPTLIGDSNILKKGTDSTVCPKDVLHIKESSPDNQSIKRDRSMFNGVPYVSISEVILSKYE